MRLKLHFLCPLFIFLFFLVLRTYIGILHEEERALEGFLCFFMRCTRIYYEEGMGRGLVRINELGIFEIISQFAVFFKKPSSVLV